MRKIIFCILCGFLGSAYAQISFEKRSDIPAEYTWNLSPLFEDWKSWENEYKSVEKAIDEFGKKEKEITDAYRLFNVLYSVDTINECLTRLYLYAMMNVDVDQGDEHAFIQQSKAGNLLTSLNNNTSWIEPYLLDINTDTVYKWINTHPPLDAYRFYYKVLLREKEHTLPEKSENMINLFNNGFYSYDDAYNSLIYLDSKPPLLQTSDNKTIMLNSTNYYDILRNNPDREIRQNAVRLMNERYNSKKETISNLINGSSSMTYGYARAYGYKSALEYFLHSDSIPVELYTNLVETIKKNTKPLRKYHELRATALKTTNYSYCDKKYSFSKPSEKYDIGKAKNLIESALKVLGEEYSQNLDSMLSQRKIDYYESEDKLTSVAYTVSYYGGMPYILTSYGDNLKDIFDLIHELGHAVHSIYSIKNQPVSNYRSSIFIDEITSTINELFLTDYLLNSKDINENRLYILQSAIENIEYYYNSALKADFVLQLFKQIENDEPVTSSFLDNLYAKLYTEYYGNSISHIDSGGWASYGIIDFYDYQYVSSMIASLNYFNKIKNDTTDKWLSNYFTLLKSGGNDFPLSQLRKAELNLMDTKNYMILPDYMTELVNTYEKELQIKGYL